MKLTTLILTLSLSCGGFAFAQQEDPFRDAFFPPEIVIHHAEELGISQADREAFQQDLQSRREAFEKAGAKSKAASEALAKTLEAHPVDSNVALKKLDAMLAAENAMKRLHVEAMISVRNQLTPEQIAKISELKRGPQLSAEQQEFVRNTIEPKMKEFHAAMQAREAAQNPPPEEVPGLINEFHQAMKAKKLEVAAKAIEQALALVK